MTDALSRPRRLPRLLALAAVTALPLAACAAGTDDSTPDAGAEPSADATSAADPSERETTEEAASTPRLTITYDGGLQVLDATTGDLVSDIPLEGFNRVNPAGDERHVFVSTTGGFQLLDAGSWAEPHGDHNHYFSTDAALLDTLVAADTPGHVVVHHGTTTLFDDATGQITVLDSADLTGAPLREESTTEAHHGVAVELENGNLFLTEGDADARTGARVLDAEGNELAAADNCPGLHGETVTDDELVVAGCEDGALVLHDDHFHKIDSPDEVGRIGNLRSASGSDVVLGDYRAGESGTPLTSAALIDVAAEEITLVDLGTEYTFRGLARDDEGHALVLGTDGAIHVIDPESAEVEQSIPVIDAWEAPEEWQEPQPSLLMLDGSAYVTDPAADRIMAVDIATGEVWNEFALDVTPNEIAGTTGDVLEGVSSEFGEDSHEGEDGHDHEGGGDHEHGGDESHDHEHGNG